MPKYHQIFSPGFSVSGHGKAENNHKEVDATDEDCMGERFSTESAETTNYQKPLKRRRKDH